MKIIKRKTLEEFWKKHANAKGSLDAWFHEMKKGAFPTPQSIKNRYASASIIEGNRVVFNIAGNKYRLIVGFAYEQQFGYIKFIGTHAEYDKVNAATVGG